MKKKSSLLIRDYNDIRSILRDIYIFGCFSREDYIRRGFSGRKYDNEQRRISAYMPEGFIKRRRENGKVLYYCNYDLHEGDGKYLAENYLTETYRNKSFTMLDIAAYFWVLSILDNNNGLSLQEILDAIPAANEDILFTKDNLRVKLGELENRELIYTRKEGRNVQYYLSEDEWAEFSVEELKQIYLLLDFVKNTVPLEMPYVFLQERLQMYMLMKGIECPKESVFQIKHSHLFNVLDNEILLQLLQVIDEQRTVMIKRIRGEETSEVIPIKIIHDCSYGRQYLLCVEYSGNAEIGPACMVRLDRINCVLPGNRINEELFAKAAEEIKNAEQCWCTSGLSDPVHRVVIEIIATDKNEAYIIRRLYREAHGGNITKTANGVYQYEVYVKDPMEMTPWIRSFGEFMRVIDDDGTGLAERISTDWKAAVKKYETL